MRGGRVVAMGRAEEIAANACTPVRYWAVVFRPRLRSKRGQASPNARSEAEAAPARAATLTCADQAVA